MLKTAYFECSSGISGDMCLGALVDAGVALRDIDAGLKKLKVKGYSLESKKVKRAGIAATKVDVIVSSKSHPERTWKEVRGIIEKSSLSWEIKDRGLKIFKKLFEAEAKVHGSSYNKTHLHELGAVDCLVDIFGTLIALEMLGVEAAYSSAVNLGGGFVKTEHGVIPVPAPATAELLKGRHVYATDIPFELTTPTGAALLSITAASFSGMPLMKIEKTGYGAGQKDIKSQSNVLRLFIGESHQFQSSKSMKDTCIIETNIDDMNPQIYEYVIEKLFKAGALDVYLNQVIMKKGRPGIVINVLCSEEHKPEIINVIFRETSTIGIRCYNVSRVVLDRKIKKLKTDLGDVRIKSSIMQDGTIKSSVEYDDCREIAEAQNIPLLDIMRRMPFPPKAHSKSQKTKYSKNG